MSQLNINRAVIGGFLPDAYFPRSAAHWPIFLTLNHVVKSASGRLTAAAGRLFSRRPILSSNDQYFQPMSWRCPGGNRPDSWRSPLGVLSITAGRQWIPRSPAVHLRVTGRSPAGVRPIWVGFGWDSLWYKYLHRHFNLLTIITILY